MWVIVVAAGSGRRFGGAKQFLPLGGRPMIAWSLATARSVAEGVVLVVPAGEEIGAGALGADRTVAGGDTRTASVRAGLTAVPDSADVIVVHDAARPLASVSLFESVISAVRSDAAAAIPVLAVADTLKRVDGDRVRSTVDRDGLVTVQTPQAFDAAALRAAHRSDAEATDDAGLLERQGISVCTVPGDVRNVKITRPEDLELAELFLHAVHG